MGSVVSAPGPIPRGLREWLECLETRRRGLQGELAEVEAKLEWLRAARSDCAMCGGPGVLRCRGGMYGEWVECPCPRCEP